MGMSGEPREGRVRECQRGAPAASVPFDFKGAEGNADNEVSSPVSGAGGDLFRSFLFPCWFGSSEMVLKLANRRVPAMRPAATGRKAGCSPGLMAVGGRTDGRGRQGQGKSGRYLWRSKHMGASQKHEV